MTIKITNDLTQIDCPRYDSYKDSGVDWLGEIPEEWSTEKGKWLFNKMDRPIRKDDGIVTCFRDGEVTLRSNRRTDGFTNALKEHGYQGIRKGDLVIHQMDAFAGAIGVSDSEGKSTPVYSVCVPKEPDRISPYYYMYFMRSMALRGFILSLAKGIRERSTDFRYNDFSKLELPLPPYNDQVKITEFIEHKTTQIDQAITLKQQQIAKLEEYKQIVIQNAVTKGLNPDVPMKDSGVDWIGEIPEHWELVSLRYLFEFLNYRRIPISADERGYMQGIYPYYGASGIIDYVNDYIFDEKLILIAEDGANLLSKSTPLAFVAEGKYWVNNHAHILKPKYKGFTFWSNLLSLCDYTIYITGAAQPKLSRGNLGNVMLPVPPEDEILAISNYLKEQLSKFPNTAQKYESQIDRLKEYKTILINQAVTGKIKVS
ncbi:restriction endonuclease subunit S [Psychrobacter sp. APC 3426]|uniref:restriction endonuclease subunit S n=1 Tax=Psychrobacter sp. APC 3426 TaxID=3035177 RepID=UPI0025B5594C|nr:restriction endonuclease subunit S [Psychrobacter sp. APC 3426]MDN3397873.1 restriction endonuclease subunit S [Psychrobacter sp. APC 3426]